MSHPLNGVAHIFFCKKEKTFRNLSSHTKKSKGLCFIKRISKIKEKN